MIMISVGGYMPKKIELRPLTEEERATLEKLIKSQTAPAIEVERGKTIWLAHALVVSLLLGCSPG
jgi:hypothetical protein